MEDMGKNGADGCSLVRQGEVALVVVDDERDAKLDEWREVRRVKIFSAISEPRSSQTACACTAAAFRLATYSVPSGASYYTYMPTA